MFVLALQLCDQNWSIKPVREWQQMGFGPGGLLETTEVLQLSNVFGSSSCNPQIGENSKPTPLKAPKAPQIPKVELFLSELWIKRTAETKISQFLMLNHPSLAHQGPLTSMESSRFTGASTSPAFDLGGNQFLAETHLSTVGFCNLGNPNAELERPKPTRVDLTSSWCPGPFCLNLRNLLVNFCLILVGKTVWGKGLAYYVYLICLYLYIYIYAYTSEQKLSRESLNPTYGPAELRQSWSSDIAATLERHTVIQYYYSYYMLLALSSRVFYTESLFSHKKFLAAVCTLSWRAAAAESSNLEHFH